MDDSSLLETIENDVAEIVAPGQQIESERFSDINASDLKNF